MKQRYLTKSRFNLAMECPTKLYYNGKDEYANQKIEDAFLLSLAEGGFQVGELAKQYFPNGHHIKTLDYDEALCQTDELLKQDKVIIYEAAISYENLYVRVDILIKNNKQIELVEVKAKSTDASDEGAFLTNKGSISSEWQKYIYDISFQKFVAQSALPQYHITANLMLADKNSKCPTDGLNQKFRIVKDGRGRKKVIASQKLTKEDLSVPILIRINVDCCCDIILNTNYGDEVNPMNFADHVSILANCFARDEKIISTLSKSCAGCEFKANEEEMKDGLKSGFHECWKNELKWNDYDFLEPTVLDIWNFRKKDTCINERRIKLSDIDEDDISPKSDDKPGVSASERQWLQIDKARNKDSSYWIDSENLKREMSKWVFPLHFIDFETTMAAIPFNKGRHPYEGIAFQYSHHIVHENGKIEHCGQYINAIPGLFPNYEFIRSLKNELTNDAGSIFRYAAHENTYLNIVCRQLIDDTHNIPDRDELCKFIRTITKSCNKSDEQWEGRRNMIDMLELVKRYYYNPAMKGSNSIKKVLPAILNSSRFLQNKYSKAIYGAIGGIPSFNYKDWTWIKYDGRQVIDPYNLMPKMFQDITDKEYSLLSESDELKDGGAALTAYAKMQFEEMSEYERSEIQKALLLYCELDTFAMVMIYEGWKDILNQH